MAIVKQDKASTFNKIQRGAPFAATKTLYTRTNGEEDPKEHVFYKLNDKKAVTLDKRTVVYFAAQDEIIPCTLEKKAKQPAQ